MKVIENLKDVREAFERLEQAPDYWGCHVLSEGVLDKLPDAPELDEALGLESHYLLISIRLGFDRI